MGKIIRTNRWGKASDDAAAKRVSRRFAAALVALPLAAFSAVLFFPATERKPAEAIAAVGFTEPLDTEQAYFPICGSGRRYTCVVDGDTIWYRGEKIRLVGFDTPEVSNPGCANEARLGALATGRLQGWLNEGAFSLEANPDGREQDRFGRALRMASRRSANVGEMLLAEGLAERRGGQRNIWC